MPQEELSPEALETAFYSKLEALYIAANDALVELRDFRRSNLQYDYDGSGLARVQALEELSDTLGGLLTLEGI